MRITSCKQQRAKSQYTALGAGLKYAVFDLANLFSELLDRQLTAMGRSTTLGTVILKHVWFSCELSELSLANQTRLHEVVFRISSADLYQQ